MPSTNTNTLCYNLAVRVCLISFLTKKQHFCSQNRTKPLILKSWLCFGIFSWPVTWLTLSLYEQFLELPISIMRNSCSASRGSRLQRSYVHEWVDSSTNQLDSHIRQLSLRSRTERESERERKKITTVCPELGDWLPNVRLLVSARLLLLLLRLRMSLAGRSHHLRYSVMYAPATVATIYHNFQRELNQCAPWTVPHRQATTTTTVMMHKIWYHVANHRRQSVCIHLCEQYTDTDVLPLLHRHSPSASPLQ